MMEIERASVKDHGIVTGMLLDFAEARGWRPEVDRDRWERVLAELLDSDRWLFLLARDRGEPVGLVAANWFLTLYGSREQARLAALIVDEKHRRKGIGTSLMYAMMEAARRRGCREIEAVIGADDEPTAAFYRRFEGHLESTSIAWRCEG